MTSPSVWRGATVVSCDTAAEDMVSIRIRPDEASPHRSGQHYEVRLPGDRLSRKFSVVSSPSTCDVLELGVQILPTGLVSPRLAGVTRNERLEIRGPIGKAFAWSPEASRDLLLLGAGAGITPLLSMWSEFHEAPRPGACRFFLTAKRPGRVYNYDDYRDRVLIHFTESAPRVMRSDVSEIVHGLALDDLTVRVCGPSPFAGVMIEGLLDLGIPEDCIRYEGFA